MGFTTKKVEIDALTDIVNLDKASNLNIDWDYEMPSETVYTAPVDIVNQRHICLEKLPNLTPPAGANKLTARYYIEYEIHVPSASQIGARLLELTFTNQARVDALTEGTPYDYAAGGGANLEPIIYCLDHDKFTNVFRGAFILYHNDLVAGDAVQTETVYMEKGYDSNDNPLIYTNKTDLFPDDTGGYPNTNDLSTALATMLYFINEGGTITAGDEIATVKKLRWKGMVYGDETFNKLPRISEYDSRIINRNVYDNDRVPFVNQSNRLQTSDVTSTELGYLSGVTSSVQTQLDNLGNAIPTNGVQVSGRIQGSDGTIVSTDIGTVPTVSRTAEGKYTISDLPSIPLAESMVYIEAVADGDNLWCVHNKTETSFQVAWRDAPNLQDQDTNFRYQWVKTSRT